MSRNSGIPRGRFITFEGGEGSGKSTQLARLKDTLEARGVAAEATREPGGTPGAEAIRALLVAGETGRWDAGTETLLHVAARRDHIVRRIAPALEAGRWVLCDRFIDSTMVYQGYAQGFDREAIARIHDLILPPLRPDLTLMLDLPVEAGLDRAGRRGTGEDRYERMTLDFHHRVRDGFRAIARDEPARCRLIDASGEVDAVARAVEAAVSEAFFAEGPSS